MRIRNINFFERHGEKLAIGVTGLVLAAATWHYLLGSPNTVTISGQTATPETVDEVILREAERLEQKLQGETPEELAGITVPSYTADFTGRRSEDLLPQPRLAGPIGFNPLFEGEDPVPGTRHPYHVPQIPDVPIVAARSDIGTIEEVELEDNDDLDEFFRQRHQYDRPDVAWVSLVGQFDMLDMVQQFSYSEDGESRRIPESWWIDDLAIVTVDLERQRRLPDGSWSEPEPVREMPGSFAYSEIEQPVEPEEAEEILDLMYDEQPDVIRRPFFALVNETWSAPDPDNPDQELEIGRISELREEIEDQERRLENAYQRLEQLQRADQRRGQTQRRNRRGGGGRGGSEPGLGDYPGDTSGGGRNRQRSNNQAPSQAERFAERVESLEEDLYELQVEFAEETGQEPPAPPRRSRTLTGPGGEGGYPGAEGGYPGEYPGLDPTDPRGGGLGGRGGSSPISPEGYPGAYPEGPGGYSEPGLGGRSGLGGRRGGTGRRNLDRGLNRNAELDEDLVRFQRSHFGAIPLEYVEDRTLDVWAHDLYVEEGETYRYRMRIGVTNPLYDRGSNLLEEQREEYDDEFLLYSDWSDWTEPQDIEPLKHFFFVDGSRNPSPGYVEAEVWRFTEGSWFQEEFEVAPGDPIGEPAEMEDEYGELTVDFFTGAYLVDVDFDHVLPGGGSLQRTTQRVVYSVETPDQPGDVTARLVEYDRDHEKRQWLQLQQELLAGDL